MSNADGGYDFAARPDLSALEQNILWSPRVDPGVLVLTHTPDPLRSGPFDAPAGLTPLRVSPEGEYAIHADGAPKTQLLFLPGASPADPIAAVIPLDTGTLGRIEALTRFWRALHGRPLPADTRMTAQQRRRLRLMMQALDGRTNGASYREIAIVQFGRERIAAEPWKTSALRDMVIGFVKGGLAMVGGGYLQLLRHRRRS